MITPNVFVLFLVWFSNSAFVSLNNVLCIYSSYYWYNSNICLLQFWHFTCLLSLYSSQPCPQSDNCPMEKGTYQTLGIIVKSKETIGK